LSTSQATNEAQNRIKERFSEYAKRIADNPRLFFAEKERQSRLDRCRAFLVNLIYVGYASDLVYSWADDLLNDEVVDGMPTDRSTHACTWIQKHGNNSSMIPFEEAIHVAPTDQPLSESFHEAQKRRLSEALTRLPVDFREVLVLREIEGWSYQQLASALNVPAATFVWLFTRPPESTSLPTTEALLKPHGQ
jgi:RNA polymerase sigma factor (sigma-70 family)